MIQTFIRCSWILLALASGARAFDLVDTHPGSPEFKQRFYGSFGINGAIEPTLFAGSPAV